MTSPTSLRGALLSLAVAAAVGGCPGEERPAPNDAPCASGQEAVAVPTPPPVERRADVAPPGLAVDRTPEPTPPSPEVLRAPRFRGGPVAADTLALIGVELAPFARPDEVASRLQPFVERLGAVAAARCDAGALPACGRLLALHAAGALVPSDPAAADRFRDALVERWLAACRAGDDRACVTLLDLPDAVTVPGRPTLGRRACARHRGVGCEVLAAVADGKKTRESLRVEAAGLYVDACDDDDPRACERLAGMYRRGEVANAKRPRARRVGLLEHAREIHRARCDAGDAYACGELGVARLAGPKPDPAAAREAFARAIPPVRLPAP